MRFKSAHGNNAANFSGVPETWQNNLEQWEVKNSSELIGASSASRSKGKDRIEDFSLFPLTESDSTSRSAWTVWALFKCICQGVKSARKGKLNYSDQLVTKMPDDGRIKIFKAADVAQLGREKAVESFSATVIDYASELEL